MPAEFSFNPAQAEGRGDTLSIGLQTASPRERAFKLRRGERAAGPLPHLQEILNDGPQGDKVGK